MGNIKRVILGLLWTGLTAGFCMAQMEPTEPSANVISGTVAAIGYPVGGGGTKVTMVGTPAASQASGEAKVDAKVGGTEVSLKVAGMPQPTALGAEFLTYVLWTVTPDGTTTNLGEIPIDKNGQGKLDATAQSQTFALIVTAEPYYAVRIPSELVILTNETRKNTKGKIYPDNSYKLMRRERVLQARKSPGLTPDLKKVPLDIYEARNAVEIAKSRGAEQYAPEDFLESAIQLADG